MNDPLQCKSIEWFLYEGTLALNGLHEKDSGVIIYDI